MKFALILFLFLSFVPNYSFADITTGLIGWWKLDEPTGTNAADSSGQGRTGTVVNNPTSITNCPRGNCLSFVIAGSPYIKMGNNYSFERTDTFSFSFWALQTTPLSQVVISKMVVGSAIGYFIASTASGNVRVTIRQAAGTNVVDVSSTATPWATPTMHHIAVTYAGTSLASGVLIYVDGVLSTKTVTSDNLSNSIINVAEFNISGRQNGTDTIWGGTIDDVRVYNRVLTAQDVYQLYLSDNKIRNATLNNFKFNN